MEWVLLLLGFAAGVLSSIMGVGGGLIVVPALAYGFGATWHEATAASLAAMVMQVPVGLVEHGRRGAVDISLGIRLVAWGGLGVLLGTRFEPPVVWLQGAFALVLALAAWRMVGKVPTAKAPALVVLVAALLAGVVAKWLGIGGGLILVPILVLAGIPVHKAVATALVAVFANAAVASAVNAYTASIPIAAIWIGVGGILGAPIGVAAAHRLGSPQLMKLLAGGLALASVAMLADVLTPP